MINYYDESKSGIFYFPPPFIFFQKVEKHEELKKLLVPQIENNLKENANNIKNDWECDVLSSFHFGDMNFLFENQLLFDEIWNAFNNCIDTLISNYWLQEDSDLRSCSVAEIWYNIYKPGGNQEIHSHDPFEFSGIYILDDSEINGTVWWNEANTFPGGLSPYAASNTSVFRGTEFGEVGEGYIVIFPGPLPHYVPNVKNNKTSLSFNFRRTNTCDDE